MNRINPYRRNCEVMRKFFSKPIFLITAIVLSLYIIANSVICFLSNQTVCFDFISIALCVALFLFYFKARSKKEFVSFRGPNVLMDVVSIVGIIFSCLIAAFSGFMTVLFMLPTKTVDFEYHGSYEFLWSTLGKAIYDLAIVVFPAVLALSLIFLLYFIGMQRMTLSFKKSLSTVYLQRKGAVMFGIMSIILAVFSIIYYAGVTTILLFGIDEYSTLFSQGIDVYALVQGFFVTLIFVLYAILGFKYNSYIKKLSDNIETGNPVQNTTNSEPENHNVVEMWKEHENNIQPPITQPVQFTPQSVFGGNSPDEVITIPTENNATENDIQNPYLNNEAIHTKRCPKCGKDNPTVNIFCGICGNRL